VNGAWMGQKISAKQLKTTEGVDSSYANAMRYNYLQLTLTFCQFFTAIRF